MRDRAARRARWRKTNDFGIRCKAAKAKWRKPRRRREYRRLRRQDLTV